MVIESPLRRDASLVINLIQKQQKKMADELRRRQTKRGTKII